MGSWRKQTKGVRETCPVDLQRSLGVKGLSDRVCFLFHKSVKPGVDKKLPKRQIRSTPLIVATARWWNSNVFLFLLFCFHGIYENFFAI